MRCAALRRPSRRPRGPSRVAALAALGLLAATGASAGSLPEFAGRVERGTVLVEASSRVAARTGTGFLVDPPGVVVTALHTVAGARRIAVSLPGLYAVSDARLFAVSTEWDVALLRVSWPAELPYPGLALDRETEPRVGTDVAVTGYGLLGTSGPRVPLTVRGIVSAAIPHRGGVYHLLDLEARAGLSGSPVYRVDSGAVTGILTRVVESPGPTGPGTAVPVSVIIRLLESTRDSALR